MNIDKKEYVHNRNWRQERKGFHPITGHSNNCYQKVQSNILKSLNYIVRNKTQRRR